MKLRTHTVAFTEICHSNTVLGEEVDACIRAVMDELFTIRRYENDYMITSIVPNILQVDNVTYRIVITLVYTLTGIH